MDFSEGLQLASFSVKVFPLKAIAPVAPKPPKPHQLLHFVVSGRLRRLHGGRFQEALEEGEDGHAGKEIGCRDDAEKMRTQKFVFFLKFLLVGGGKTG